MISFDCQCGKPFRFSAKFKGRPFRCNVCGRPLVVPEDSAASTPEMIAVGEKHRAGEIITPVKPVLTIDLDSLPRSMKNVPKTYSVDASEDDVDDTPINGNVPPALGDDTVSELDDEDDHVVISGKADRIKDEEFSVDRLVEPPEESDSTSTILSKDVLSTHLQEIQDFAKSTDEIPVHQSVAEGPKKKEKRGFFSKKKPTEITDDTAKPKAEPKQKSGLFSRKKAAPVVENAAEPVVVEPTPKAEPKQKSGLFSRKKAAPVVENAAEPVVAEPAPKAKPKKTEKPAKEPGQKSSLQKKMGTIFTVVLLLLFIGATAMLIIEKGKTGEAQKKITTLESQVKTLREQASKVEAPAVVPENNGETVTETPTSEVPENVDTPMPELDLPLLE